MSGAGRQLGTRAKHLLLALLRQDGPVVIANLARQFGVSPRSIRYDLDEIEGWLQSAPVKLYRRPRVGIWVEGAPEGLAQTRERLGLVEDYRPVLSPEQRRNIIVARLLQRDDPVTSHALADELRVSRTTVFADLDNVEAWLTRRGLALVRRSNYGLKAVGEESAWRRAVSDLLGEFAESGELGCLLMEARRGGGGGAPSQFAGAPHLLALLNGLDLRVVEGVVRDAEVTAGVEFTTSSYSALVFQVAVAVSRLKQGKCVEMPRERLAALKSTPEYALAVSVADRLAETFGVAVPETEVGTLALHLAGAKVRGPAVLRTGEAAAAATLPLEDVEASAVAALILESADRELGFVLRPDEPMRHSLAMHLRPALRRLRYGLPATNPLLGDIKATYPRLYRVAEKACAAAEPLVGLGIPPEEVGFVALHLAAAVLRRYRTRTGSRRVVLATTGGVGVNEILAARVATEFPDLEILATASVHGLKAVVAERRPDFVISTSPVPDHELDVVVVGPLLGEDDIDRVRAFMDRAFRPTEDRLLAELTQV